MGKDIDQIFLHVFVAGSEARSARCEAIGVDVNPAGYDGRPWLASYSPATNPMACSP